MIYSNNDFLKDYSTFICHQKTYSYPKSGIKKIFTMPASAQNSLEYYLHQ